MSLGQLKDPGRGYFGGGVVVPLLPFFDFLPPLCFLPPLWPFLPVSVVDWSVVLVEPVVQPPAWANDRLAHSASANNNVSNFFIDPPYAFLYAELRTRSAKNC